MTSKGDGSATRLWLVPMGVLAAVALLVFTGFYALDALLGDGGALAGYFDFEPAMITDAIPALAGLMAAVLGIVITVVSIIVQLSADRYTGVAAMFLRDRINLAVMAYFVIACVCGIWLSMSVHAQFVPRTTLIAMMAATSFGLLLMLPYFAYVFRFLEPTSIVGRIRAQAVATVTEAAGVRDAARGASLQGPVIKWMEELSDITSNSISGKDKIIASRAVDALKDFTLEYLAVKGKAQAAWFDIGEGIRDNPDFVAMDPESLRDLEARRTWVEWKVMRQYLGIYNEAMSDMPDINYLIAIDTRYIGEAAAARQDREVVALVFRYLNSYLRATLNARAVRTAYNVLNQYRLLVESMLRLGDTATAIEGVRHMVYYGLTSFDMQLSFVTETVAYDLSAVCEFAHSLGKKDDARLLAMFLELDQPLRVRRQEQGLLGIRKAQVKLAAYYLAAGEEARARSIADDMRDEPRERLRAIRDQLERVESKDFWEIIDRGRNFEYMPPRQRAQMARFFAWFDEPEGLAREP